MIIQKICKDCVNLIEYILKEKVYCVGEKAIIDGTKYYKCKYNIEAKEGQLYKDECIIDCSLKSKNYKTVDRSLQ